MVQPWEMWWSHEVNAERVKVCKVSDPVYKDPWNILGVEFGQWRNFRLWRDVSRDLDGTMELETPTPLQFPLPLSGGKVPAACVLYALHDHGFVEMQGPCVRLSGGLLTFDSRNVISCRPYFQCVLVRDELFAKVIPNFPSNRSHTCHSFVVALERTDP